MAKRESQLDRAVDYALAEAVRVGDPAKLPPAVRTVLLVHAAQGIIDNGGLQYFFESDWANQPPYSIFVNGYRAIGSAAEADALAAAVQLFPFAEPHKHQRRRDKFLEQFHKDGGHRSDSPFEPYTDQPCGTREVVYPTAAEDQPASRPTLLHSRRRQRMVAVVEIESISVDFLDLELTTTHELAQVTEVVHSSRRRGWNRSREFKAHRYPAD